MGDKPSFDTGDAHEYFSTHCFNLAWQLMDKSNRSIEDDEQMIRLTQVSLWHWTQRSDCKDENLSIGHWQASRVYALLGQVENARKNAQSCLEKTPADEPYLLGCAYEALARAESIAENSEKTKAHLAKAWQHAEEIADDKEKKLLTKDLKMLA